MLRFSILMLSANTRLITLTRPQSSQLQPNFTFSSTTASHLKPLSVLSCKISVLHLFSLREGFLFAAGVRARRESKLADYSSGSLDVHLSCGWETDHYIRKSVGDKTYFSNCMRPGAIAEDRGHYSVDACKLLQNASC